MKKEMNENEIKEEMLKEFKDTKGYLKYIKLVWSLVLISMILNTLIDIIFYSNFTVSNIIIIIERLLNLIFINEIEKLLKDAYNNKTPFLENNNRYLKRIGIIFGIIGVISMLKIFGIIGLTVGSDYFIITIFIVSVNIKHMFKYGKILQQESDETL